MTVDRESEPRLQMVDISKRFGATVALNRVNFEVLPGEVHALVGENGAGKSTLMKILSGAYRSDTGVMFLERETYEPHNPLDARLKGVGMIYQELSLAPHLTVEENILLGMEPTRLGVMQWGEVRKRAVDAINRFQHSEIRPDTPVSELSVSAQQLVEIARSLAVGCQVLVLDEPTSSLSQADIRQLFEIIQDLKEQGLSIIYISHFLEEVKEVAGRLTVLRDGEVVGTREVDAVTPDEIIEMMVGREVDQLYPRSSRTTGAPVLEITHLAGKRRPRDASLVLRKGEVVGISGLIGAGRTELIRTIFGLDPVQSGEVKVGMYRGPASPRQRWNQGVGMLSENRKEEGLAVGLSIMDNVTLSGLGGLGPMGLVMPSKQRQVVARWIDRLDIRCREPGQTVQELSGGNQQKAALARLLHTDVEVLLLDEPTKGIDVASKAKIYQVIDELATGKGDQNGEPKAILMISSYLPELLGVCDRIAVMHRGELSEAKPVSELDEHAIMMAATGQGVL